MLKFCLHLLLGFNLIKNKYKKIKNKIKILAKLNKTKMIILGDDNIFSANKDSFFKKTSFFIKNNNNMLFF